MYAVWVPWGNKRENIKVNKTLKWKTVEREVRLARPLSPERILSHANFPKRRLRLPIPNSVATAG